MPTYTLTETPAPEDTAALEQCLTAYLTDLGADAKDRKLTIFTRDDHGKTIGGLIAKTGWDQMYLSTLYVAEPHRGQGIGAQLMEQAEAEARHRGCRASWLMTSTLDGKAFYESRGYECVGEVERHAPSGARWFMKKGL